MSKYLAMLRSLLNSELILDHKMLGLGRARRMRVPPVTNYIRISTLELAAQEIYEKNVAGAVAEVGVYKGGFAKYLNQIFSDRTLYLFDTFEGFDEKDVKIETTKNYSRADQDFSDTSAERVLSGMMHPDKCVIKKGWFPDSLGGLEDTFCLVSLDADLYKPIYDSWNTSTRA